MKDPNDTRNIGPRIGSPLWMWLSGVTTVGLLVLLVVLFHLDGLPQLVRHPLFWLVAALIVVGETRPIVTPGRPAADAPGRLVDLQLRRPALLGLPGRGGVAGGHHAGRRADSAQGRAPVGFQCRAGHAEPGRRRAGAGRHRNPARARPALDPGRRAAARGGARRAGLLRSELPAGRRRHRAALAGPDRRDAPGRSAVPGLRQHGAAQRRVAGRCRDGGRVAGVCAAVRLPARGHLRQRGDLGATGAPGSPR